VAEAAVARGSPGAARGTLIPPPTNALLFFNSPFSHAELCIICGKWNLKKDAFLLQKLPGFVWMPLVLIQAMAPGMIAGYIGQPCRQFKRKGSTQKSNLWML
jgi:hypothetical protein